MQPGVWLGPQLQQAPNPGRIQAKSQLQQAPNHGVGERMPRTGGAGWEGQHLDHRKSESMTREVRL